MPQQAAKAEQQDATSFAAASGEAARAPVLDMSRMRAVVIFFI
jgi:hypothetical protein